MADRMRIVEGDLPHTLRDLAHALNQGGRLVAPEWDPEMESPGIRMATLSSNVTRATSDAISPVQATVVLASIAEAAGSSDAAFHLLTRTMPHHSKAGLLGDPAMQLQQRMLAGEMIEMARLHPALRAEPGITALEALSLRELRPDTVGLALQALAFALCGDAVSCDAAGLQALRESREDFHPARRADTICALARGWTVCERWDTPLREALREEYERMFHFGDEPRRIRVGTLYGRFLIEAGEIESSRARAGRLSGSITPIETTAAAQRPHRPGWAVHLALRRGADALRTLRSVYGHFERSGQRLRLAETLLPMREAAVAAGDAELLGRSQEVLDGS